MPAGASLHAIGLYRRVPADSSGRAYYFRMTSRMTWQTQTRVNVPWRDAPEVLAGTFRPKTRGRGECRMPVAPAASRVESGDTRVSPPRSHRDHPAFPHTVVLTVSFVLSSVIGFLVTVAGVMRSIITNLTPASRRQDHTTSPSASAPFVSRAPSRPPHPAPNVRDDRDTPLLRARDSSALFLFLPIGQAENIYVKE
jgi:hypothetical protein